MNIYCILRTGVHVCTMHVHMTVSTCMLARTCMYNACTCTYDIMYV